MAKNLRKRKFLRKTLKKKRRKHRSRNFRKKKRKSYKKKYIKNKTRKRNRNKKKIIQKGGRIAPSAAEIKQLRTQFITDANGIFGKDARLELPSDLMEDARFFQFAEPEPEPAGAEAVAAASQIPNVLDMQIENILSTKLDDVYMSYLSSETMGFNEVSPLHADIITRANEIIYFQNIQHMISKNIAITNIIHEMSSMFGEDGRYETVMGLLPWKKEEEKKKLGELIEKACWSVLTRQYSKSAIISAGMRALLEPAQSGGNITLECKKDWGVGGWNSKEDFSNAVLAKQPMDFLHDFSNPRDKKLLFSKKSGTSGLLNNAQTLFWKHGETNDKYLDFEKLGDLQPVWKSFFITEDGKVPSGQQKERNWLVKNMHMKIQKCPEWKNSINTYKVYRIPAGLVTPPGSPFFY